MKQIAKTIERTMAAVAFAESTEYEKAMAVAGIRARVNNNSLLERIEHDLVTITFAEADCCE